VAGFLDSNVALRYLVRDNEPMFLAARQLIDSDEALYLTHAIIAEIAHVLLSVYGVSRSHVVEAIVGLLGKDNIHVSVDNSPELRDALLLCRDSGRVSIDDALLWATARASRNPVVYTFDRRFPAPGISVRHPGS
jgi:predicted nucleic acid-binding protein